MPSPAKSRGFTITDLTATLALLAIAAALALAATRQMRQEAQHASSLSQLHWIAGASTSYAADNADRLWSFSWQQGATPSAYPDLQFATSPLDAAAFQAVDILRRRGRPDMPRITGWVPHIQYNHLPLLDYLDRDIPDFNFVTAGDPRLAWARDPAGFDAGAYLPVQPAPGDRNKRWPYSMSFEVSVGFFDRGETGVQRLAQGSVHYTWLTPSFATLGAPRVAEIAHPSQKVHIYETAQRDFGVESTFFLFPEARVPILMADGSAGVRLTGDSNRGWNPRVPASAVGTSLQYSPRAWEPAGASTIVNGHYRFTRGGIAGRDFGGPEINTGQP